MSLCIGPLLQQNLSFYHDWTSVCNCNSAHCNSAHGPVSIREFKSEKLVSFLIAVLRILDNMLAVEKRGRKARPKSAVDVTKEVI